tara:strand:+ start:1046 stop:1279 length:234 start_codon:yes stop_codon:yes gene_type:complete
MIFTKESIDKIFNYTSISNIEKINRMLKIDATQYTNLGIDSTKSEKEIVKKNSKYIYKVISRINPEIGRQFLEHQDK